VKRSMGNVKFVGELYKIELLTEKIMHQCIRKLLGDIKNPAHEDVESLCSLMRTIGKKLDQEKAASYMSQYFDRMAHMSREEVGLPKRLRFMLQEVIDLRNNSWTARDLQVETGPMTLSDVHRDHAINQAKASGVGRAGINRMMKEGAIGGIAPPSMAHIRGGAASGGGPRDAIPPPAPGGSGGFGGGPGGGFGPSAPVRAPAEKKTEKKSGPISGSILGDRRKSLDKSAAPAAPVKLSADDRKKRQKGSSENIWLAGTQMRPQRA